MTLELPQSVQAIEDPKYATTLLQPLNYQSANVLVVEDNQINQVIVQTQLTYLGVTSDLVNDGQQALAYLDSHKPDLILMDLQMPIMDGFTASGLTKQNKKSQDIPIIILSASVGKEEKEKASELGIEDFINKPFQHTDLQYVLNKYLSKKEPQC